MSILIGPATRLVVQGITGREGGFHAAQMLAFGTQVVAGVTPGKGGQLACEGRIPVFDTVREAVTLRGANTSAVFVPAAYAADAILEAAEAGISLIVCITEGIPVHDMLLVRGALRGRPVRLIGPNSPGLLAPGSASVGIMPGGLALPGTVGVVSRSGTLTYEVMRGLSAKGLGQSTCVGIGGDPIVGTDFVQVLDLFDKDAQTSHVVLIGEIGGNDEERAAEYISGRMSKPVTAFIAGRAAPAGRRMGHAGAIVEGALGRAVDKIAALSAAGAQIAEEPDQVAEMVERVARNALAGV